MIDKKLLFVIPIYYRSLEDHGKEYTKKYEVFRKNKIKAWGKQFKEEYKNPLKLDLEFQRNWFSWDYTQIVHYVEIYKENNMLKSYLHTDQ